MVQAPLASLLSTILSRLTYSVSIGWDAERAAGALGLRLLTVDATQPRDLDRSFERIVKGGAQALLVLTDPMLSAQARQIAELATRHRLPGMYWAKWFEAGGLAAYSADHENLTRRAADYVDRILKDTEPADLPVEQPTKFELVINLKTAKGARPDDPADAPAAGGRIDRVTVLDQHGQLLRAAVGFAGCSMPSYDRSLHALRTWLYLVRSPQDRLRDRQAKPWRSSG